MEVGVLRASPTRLALIRSWDVDLKRVGVSFKVNGSAGVTYQGAPALGQNMLVLAVASFGAGHPIAKACQFYAGDAQTIT